MEVKKFQINDLKEFTPELTIEEQEEVKGGYIVSDDINGF